MLHSIGFHNDCIFIFNRFDNWKFDEPNGDRAVATGYCCLSILEDKMGFGTQGPDCIEVNTVKPATKIQRDLLFQKMKEAGWEWDAERKELEKIEHESTDNPDSLIEESNQQQADALIDMITEEKDMNEYNKGFECDKQRVLKYPEDFGLCKKIAWSEEDENRINRLIAYFEDKESFTAEDDIVYANWLKSLKERL